MQLSSAFICLTIAGLDFLLKDLTFPMYKVLRHLTVDNEFLPFRSRNLNYECLKPENWSNQDQFLSLLYRRAVTLRRITFTYHHYYLPRIQKRMRIQRKWKKYDYSLSCTVSLGITNIKGKLMEAGLGILLIVIPEIANYLHHETFPQTNTHTSYLYTLHTHKSYSTCLLLTCPLLAHPSQSRCRSFWLCGHMALHCLI